MENGRRLFTIGAMIDGVLVAEAKAFNKKDASQVAAQIAIEKLNLLWNLESSEVEAGQRQLQKY